MIASESVTVVVTRTVRAGAEPAYEAAWLYPNPKERKE